MKRIVILGSTGSVGTQALDIIKQHPEKFKVVGLSANHNIEKLQEQIAEFKPEAVCIADPTKQPLSKQRSLSSKAKRGLKTLPL